MYRHVAKYHLDLGQLWRSPVSWCTVWKGTPQDCMDHVRGRMICHGTSNLQASRSLGVSTDVLLFSEINESLVHHYRVHKRGLPHLTFQRDYLTCLRVFVSQAAALSQGDMVSPVYPSPVPTSHACSSEQESVSPQKTRRAHRRICPIRVLEKSVGVGPPTWTVQDVSDLTGAVVHDCRPPLLPVSRCPCADK